MVIVIVLAALSLWSLIATLVEVRRDGHHAVRTDWSKVAERDHGEHAPTIPPHR